MKKVLLITALLSCSVFAAEPIENTLPKSSKVLNISREALGIGTPAPMISIGTERAQYIDDGYYHAPQDMPYYPTAAVIWPRVVEVPCEYIHGKMLCEGYHWQPKLGRAEYLFVIPKMKEIIEPPAPVVMPAPIVILKEVPVKRKGQ